MKTLHETLHTPITHTCDVLVAGGGVAATLGDDISAIDVTVLQENLRKNGVVIHEKDL